MMNVTAAKTPHAIDPSRTVKDDPDAPDGVWVAVVGPDMDSVESLDAKIDAVKYVSEVHPGGSAAIDKSYGPFADDGTVTCNLNNTDNGNGGVQSVDQYLRAAAEYNLGAKGGNRSRAQYVCFHRVRRTGLY